MACSEAKRKTKVVLFIYKADPEHIILHYTTLYHADKPTFHEKYNLNNCDTFSKYFPI